MQGTGKILYNEDKGRLFIRIIGEMRHTMSGGFQALLKKYMTADSPVEEILIDMNESRYLDSTNLGLLAQIARYLIRRFNRKPTVLCANRNILVLLETMGFDQIFTIIQSSDPNPPELQEVDKVSQDAREKGRMMLDAHRALIDLNERNAKVFKNVVDLLEKELGADGTKKQGGMT